MATQAEFMPGPHLHFLRGRAMLRFETSDGYVTDLDLARVAAERPEVSMTTIKKWIEERRPPSPQSHFRIVSPSDDGQ